MIRVGRISACIAGDYRYSTILEVHCSPTRIEIRTGGTGAVGGMDGDGRAFDLPTMTLTSFEHPDGGKLVVGYAATWAVKTLRRLFKTHDCGTIAKYGKPSKNFTWYGTEANAHGLSIALASAAIRPIVEER